MNRAPTKTRTILRVLIVDDSEDDTALLVQALRRGGAITYQRVDSPSAMSSALAEHEWDVIIADFSMPHFSGPEARALAIERASDLPFILISGAVSEETAVEAMRAGADDYFSKGNFARLVPAIERELHQADARRKAGLIETHLRKRQAHLADALQLAQVGTWHLDITTNTAVWSDEACRIAGFTSTPAGPAFEELLERLHPKDRALLVNLLQHPATKRFAEDLQMIRADGAAQFVNISGDIIRGENLVPLEAAGTIQDITDRKEVEAQVERVHVQLMNQNQKLLALTRQAHEFVDDVSHEFRTPLAVIKEFASIITDGLAGPITTEQGQYLGIIDNAVLDLNQMVEDFLDSSKLRAGLLRVDRRPQTVDSIFARIRPGLQKKAASRTITLDECIDAQLPLAFADEEKVRRVIMNLASNAVKFSPEGSQVTLWAGHASEGGVEIGVTDHGRGLAPVDLKRLFARFRQVPASDAPIVKGFGLGLNIARQLVWLNLGKMSVTSEVGRGSTFSFTLPANDPRMILERFIMRLAECNDAVQSVAVISVAPADPAESVDALQLFLAATTRPSDVILQMPEPANGMLLLGPTGSVDGWVSRLTRAREQSSTSSVAEKFGPFQIKTLGTFICPTGASDMTACALEHLAWGTVHA